MSNELVNREITVKSQARQIAKDNGLDFTIVKMPLGGVAPDGVKLMGALKSSMAFDTPYFGLFNSKTGDCINTCKKGYTVSQNIEVLELILEGMQGFGSKLSVEMAGSLNGGRKTYVQMCIEGDALIGNDVVKRYVTAIDSNDGSTGLSIGIGDLTMSCDNEFYKFYKRGEAKFRHSKKITEKIQEIPQLIELAIKESDAQMNVYKKFAKTKVSAAVIDELVLSVFGNDRDGSTADLTNKTKSYYDKIYNFIEGEVNDKGMNLWGLHSGITKFTTHGRTIKQRENGLKESLMTGTSYPINMNSFKFCVDKSGLLLKPRTEMMLENI